MIGKVNAMKITVLGGGAMGGLFSCYLSRQNDVTIVDVNQVLVDKINQDGLQLREPDGSTQTYHPRAVSSTQGMAPSDLVIVFVKSTFSQSALRENQGIIGPETYLLTLQNGSGHEEILSQFTDMEHIVIGATQHNAAVVEQGLCSHGGSGMTYLGCLEGDASRLQGIADTFQACGLDAQVKDDVTSLIWNKMFTNVSASVLTGILQVPLGFITESESAWNMCCQLIAEAVDVAVAMGMDFDYEAKKEEVRAVCTNSPAGLTSVYADLKAGRKTEVDTISGSVVRAGQRVGVPTPSHHMIVQLIHAIEDKNAREKLSY